MKISKKEIEELTEEADKGNSEAQYDLGYKYFAGWRGLKKNRDLGAKYLKLARKNGHVGAKTYISNRLTKTSKESREIWDD